MAPKVLPWKPIFAGYDVVTVRAVFLDAVLSCHFDHGLVRLGTGVLIEDLVHADGLADFLSKQCLRDGVWIVEGMHDIVELLFCCCNNFRGFCFRRLFTAIPA